jgi:hypothetical protein
MRIEQEMRNSIWLCALRAKVQKSAAGFLDKHL